MSSHKDAVKFDYFFPVYTNHLVFCRRACESERVLAWIHAEVQRRQEAVLGAPEEGSVRQQTHLLRARVHAAQRSGEGEFIFYFYNQFGSFRRARLNRTFHLLFNCKTKYGRENTDKNQALFDDDQTIQHLA